MKKNLNHPHTFKSCTLCGKVWHTRKEFIGDLHLHFNGIQKSLVRTGGNGQNLLVFTHMRRRCGTTLLVRLNDFKEYTR